MGDGRFILFLQGGFYPVHRTVVRLVEIFYSNGMESDSTTKQSPISRGNQKATLPPATVQPRSTPSNTRDPVSPRDAPAMQWGGATPRYVSAARTKDRHQRGDQLYSASNMDHQSMSCAQLRALHPS